MHECGSASRAVKNKLHRSNASAWLQYVRKHSE